MFSQINPILGDWLSAKGIQSLLATHEIREHFCDLPFLSNTLRELSKANSTDMIVIGGGGLFMDYFTPFWEGFLPISQRVQFCIWGVGFCEVKSSASIPPIDLMRTIVNRALVCVVRDEISRNYLSGCRLDQTVPCPSFNVIEPPGTKGNGLVHVDSYDNVGESSFSKTVDLLQEYTAASGRRYFRLNNIIKSGNEASLELALGTYRKCEIVISSRLHGCVVGIAMNRKVIAISGDRKVESFMSRANLDDWVIDYKDVNQLPEYLAKLVKQGSHQSFCERVRSQNSHVAARVNDLINFG